MSREYQVIHKKSNVLTNGQPKLPSASTIEYGEIAINYAKGGETMSIKNANNEIVTFSSDSKILGQMPAVADYFDGAEYDTNSKRINFKHGNTVKAYIDATNFIKDGMVDDVEITTPTGGTNSGVTCLVVTFNTDAGKEDIEIPLSLIFDPSNYYDKDEADETFLTISAYTEDEEVVAAALNDLNDRIGQIYVPHNVSDLYNDLDFVDSSHTHSQYATTAHTHTAAEVGAMATSERSNYATTAHTHTAAEVGAMATSERSNYSTTGHTHSQYATTAHTHTAAEVGAMATSERSNYSTTGHTHSQYATTAHTHDYLPLSGGDMTGEFFVINPSNEMEHTQFLKNGITFSKDSSTAIHLGPGWLSGSTFGSNLLFLPEKTGMIATTDDIPDESDLTSSGFTKNGLTSADTASVFFAIYGTTTYSEINQARTDRKVILAKNSANQVYTCDGETFGVGFVFTHINTYTSNNNKRLRVNVLICNSSNQWSEETYILADDTSISGSGYTKNAITGINVNGSASTVTNGVAEVNIAGLPTVTAADNGKIPMVVNGAWSVVSPTMIYSGNSTPQASMGNDGDIYLQTS